jgi:hypothetical protein
MKPQDIIFFTLFLALIAMRKFEHLLILGLFCIVLSIPLFSLWIFFTAERMTWYASVCIVMSIFYLLLRFYRYETEERKRV